ncbi:hypothetical protein ACFXPV_24420 [Streptomyces sp. NPDC059118]|uniref:hypothetical protein n=1 Tax=unclassified Streptomyces TaxID=2593676 RepID=UPI00367CCA49
MATGSGEALTVARAAHLTRAVARAGRYSSLFGWPFAPRTRAAAPTFQVVASLFESRVERGAMYRSPVQSAARGPSS